MPTLSSIITTYLVPLIPGRWRLPFVYRRHCAGAVGQHELLEMEKIPTQFRVAVDVGANQGLYSYKMSRHFREVYAFEVNDDLTADLRDYAAENIRVFDQGLSSRAGEATLYIPVLENGFALTGWASLSQEDVAQEVAGIKEKVKFAEKPVKIAVLDDFKLREVDLIKIDVEGHEAEVLRGALETLRNNRPRLLVEAKGRLDEVDTVLSGAGYRRVRLEDLVGLPAQEDLYLYLPLEETMGVAGKSA